MAITALLAERPLYKNQIMIIKLILKTLIQKHHNKQIHDVSSDLAFKAYVSEEILNWHCHSLSLNAELCIHFH